MKRKLARGLAILVLALLAAAAAHAQVSEYAIGADVSFLKQAEDSGRVFKDNGQTKPGLRILRDHGYNWVRLRIFRDPKELPNNLPYTIALAQQAKKLGFHFLLDFHYSDTWADPGKQFTPAAWQGMTHAQLVQAVYEYTRDTIAAMRQADVLPDMVQVGNEITHGMLWPDGKLPENWDHFADLLQAGIAGVRAGSADQPMPRIMIHIDRGGDMIGTRDFFNKLNTYGVPYDVIGQSYYPYWHGNLNDLRRNLIFMAREYHKDIIVAETAYSWKPISRPANAPARFSQRPLPFPETPEGQAQFLDELNRVVREAPEGRGAGVFWWEPAVMRGPLEPRGFFDSDGNAQPVIHVFEKFTRP